MDRASTRRQRRRCRSAQREPDARGHGGRGCGHGWGYQPHLSNGSCRAHAHTDLPEGIEVELLLVEPPVDDATDYPDDEERARLHAALERSMEQAEAGQVVEAEEVMAELRAME